MVFLVYTLLFYHWCIFHGFVQLIHHLQKATFFKFLQHLLGCPWLQRGVVRLRQIGMRVDKLVRRISIRIFPQTAVQLYHVRIAVEVQL